MKYFWHLFMISELSNIIFVILIQAIQARYWNVIQPFQISKANKIIHSRISWLLTCILLIDLFSICSITFEWRCCITFESFLDIKTSIKPMPFMLSRIVCYHKKYRGVFPNCARALISTYHSMFIYPLTVIEYCTMKLLNWEAKVFLLKFKVNFLFG